MKTQGKPARHSSRSGLQARSMPCKTKPLVLKCKDFDGRFTAALPIAVPITPVE